MLWGFLLGFVSAFALLGAGVHRATEGGHRIMVDDHTPQYILLFIGADGQVVYRRQLRPRSWLLHHLFRDIGLALQGRRGEDAAALCWQQASMLGVGDYGDDEWVGGAGRVAVEMARISEATPDGYWRVCLPEEEG